MSDSKVRKAMMHLARQLSNAGLELSFAFRFAEAMKLGIANQIHEMAAKSMLLSMEVRNMLDRPRRIGDEQDGDYE